MGTSFGETLVRELANGSFVLVHPDSEVRVVSIQLWCHTGSFHEGRWAGSGISHFLEHLIFKGSLARSGQEFVLGLQELGGHVNAYTSFDRTVYHVDLPAEHWKEALELLCDAVLHPAIPEPEFEPEKDVIRRELAMVADDPDAELFQLGLRTAFSHHPFRYPVIGIPDLFEALTRKDVLAYHQERYCPQNLTLVVSGAVEPAEVFSEAAQSLGKEKARPMAQSYIPGEPDQMVPRRSQKEFVTEVSRVLFLYQIPGYEDPSGLPLLLLSLVAGGGRSSRFHRILVEEEGLAEEVEVFTHMALGAGVFGVGARCQNEKRGRLIARIRELVDQLGKNPVARNELERARRQALLQRWHSLKTASGRAGAIGWGWLVARDPGFYDRVVERIQGIEEEEIVECARRFLDPRRENLAELVPKGEREPFLEKGHAHGHGELPLPHRYRLGKGTRVVARQDQRVPLVGFHVLFPGGVFYEKPETAGLARLAAQLLPKGTRRRKAMEIAGRVEELGGYLEADGGNNSARLSIELLKQSWRDGLEIFLEILMEFCCREEELETERRKQLSLLAVEREDPVSVARDLLRRTLFAGHPYERNPLGTPETLARVGPQDVEEFVREVFFQASAVFGVAGDFCWEEVQGMMEPVLSAWGQSVPGEPTGFPPVPLREKPVRVEQQLPKEQAVIFIGFPTPGLQHPWQIPLAIAAEALSDLGGRLFVKIRQEHGLAYFTGATRFLGLAGGWFAFYVGTDPTRKEWVEKLLWEEIERLAVSGLDKGEVERAKAKLLSEDRMSDQDTAGVVAASALHELVGLGYDYAWRRRKKIEALTEEEVRECLVGCLGQKGPVTVVVSP